MAFKALIAAATSVALMTAPTMAAAQQAAAAATQVAPANETIDEGSGLRGGFVIPLLALIAIILGLCAANVICDNEDDLPTSP